jgi:hypothetical protein
MHTSALEEAEWADAITEPQPEPPTTQPEAQESETTAEVPTEPNVIEGEVIAIEPPEASEDYPPQKPQPYWLLIPFTILCCIVFVAASSLLPLLSPSATITIIPATHDLSIITSIQVHSSVLPALTLSQSQTTQATGKRHQDATQAHGAITFYNGQFRSQTIAAGTILTGVDGVAVITDQPARIPAGNPPSYGQVSVTAHAMHSGAPGNIQAYDISQACCTTSVLAKNTEAFRGGADAMDVTLVTNDDIQRIATSLTATLTTSEQAALQAQLIPGEGLSTLPCSNVLHSDHLICDQARQVTVALSQTCTAVVYSTAFLQDKATRLLTQAAAQQLGTAYRLMGTMQVSILHPTRTDQRRGLATIAVRVDAGYAYHLSQSEAHHLAILIAGKSKPQAQHILLAEPGIQGVTIQAANTTTLPTDPMRMRFLFFYRLFINCSAKGLLDFSLDRSMRN